MIKVLQILTQTAKRAGDAQVVMRYYREIDKKNFSFDFALVKAKVENNFDEEIFSLGGKVFEMPSVVKLKNFSNELLKILKENNYDMVHLHVPVIQKLVRKIINKYNRENNKKLKLIVHSHSTKLSANPIKNFRNKFFVLGINKNANYKFACSELAGNALFGKSFGKKDNSYIMHNAIIPNEFYFNKSAREKIRKELNINKEDVVFIHVGRFNKVKNHQFLIKSFKAICDSDNNSKLLLVGNGELENQIKDMVKAMNLTQNVFFLGFRNDVVDLLSAADIFMLPSLFEGMPVVAVEAQSSGVYCLLSSTITKEAVASDKIYYLDIDKPSVWAEKAFELENKVKDNDRKSDIGKYGYDISVEVKKLENLYQKIAEEK